MDVSSIVEQHLHYFQVPVAGTAHDGCRSTLKDDRIEHWISVVQQIKIGNLSIIGGEWKIGLLVRAAVNRPFHFILTQKKVIKGVIISLR